MAVTDDEINKAVAVTGRFENAGDPWRGRPAFEVPGTL